MNDLAYEERNELFGHGPAGALSVLRSISTGNPAKFERFYWNLNAIWSPGCDRSALHKEIDRIRADYYQKRREPLPPPPKVLPISQTNPAAKLAKLDAMAKKLESTNHTSSGIYRRPVYGNFVK